MAMIDATTMATLATPTAWDPSVLIDLGLPADLVMKMIADGPRAKPEAPRLHLEPGRHRGSKTTLYVWGPDIPALLGR